MSTARRSTIRIAIVALTVAMSHASLGAARAPRRQASAPRATQSQTASLDVPKLTVRLTPLVRLTRGDAHGAVIVPRHANNRVLRVILESPDYYSLSEVPLDGEDAPQSHAFDWRDLPPGSYRLTVLVYGTSGLRDSTSIGSTELLTKER